MPISDIQRAVVWLMLIKSVRTGSDPGLVFVKPHKLMFGMTRPSAEPTVTQADVQNLLPGTWTVTRCAQNVPSLVFKLALNTFWRLHLTLT